MSRSGRIIAPFGNGKHTFQLNIGQLEELQELTDAGPEEVYQRILEGRWRLADIQQPIRLGLVGAGVDPYTALALVERYAGPGHLLALKPLSSAIIGAVLIGAPDEDKPAPGETPGSASPSPTENGGSQTSTKSAARSASRPARSREPASGA